MWGWGSVEDGFLASWSYGSHEGESFRGSSSAAIDRESNLLSGHANLYRYFVDGVTEMRVDTPSKSRLLLFRLLRIPDA